MGKDLINLEITCMGCQLFVEVDDVHDAIGVRASLQGILDEQSNIPPASHFRARAKERLGIS